MDNNHTINIIEVISGEYVGGHIEYSGMRSLRILNPWDCSNLNSLYDNYKKRERKLNKRGIKSHVDYDNITTILRRNDE